MPSVGSPRATSQLSNCTAVVLPPHTSTPRARPLWPVAPDSSAAKAAAPPGSATTRSSAHSAACACRIVVLAPARTSATAPRDREHQPPTPRAARSAAMPPAGARPAARRQAPRAGRRASGSTATTLTRPSYQAAMPPISPPPPTATSSVSMSGASPPAPCRPCPAPARSRPGRRRGPASPRRGGVRFARGQGVGVALADDTSGAVAADALGLGRRGDAGHEDGGGDAQPVRGIGHGGAVIAARGRDHAGCRHLAQQQVREGSPRLERAGMLQQLQLEQPALRRQAEIGVARPRPAACGAHGDGSLARLRRCARG